MSVDDVACLKRAPLPDFLEVGVDSESTACAVSGDSKGGWGLHTERRRLR